MNFKNLTHEAKVDLFKQLIGELDLDQLKEETPEFKIVRIDESVEPALRRLSHPDELDGISTGYTDLDKITGGFAEEELIVVGGGTGQGKTQFVQSILLNMVLNNNPVLFFTLEMSRAETTARFMQMIKAKCSDEIIPELPVYYYDGDNVNLQILEEAIKQGKEMGIKCVAIDHLHFFARHVDNQSAEIGNITRSIKLLARKYKIPIILISHIRKINNTSTIPGLDDLRDSSFIAQDSDMVLMVWRDTETTERHAQRTLKVRVRKNRRRGTLDGCQYYMDENHYLLEVDYEHNADQL